MDAFDLHYHRLEIWNLLAKELELNASDTLDSILTELRSIERYWAFPGPEVLDKIATYYEQDSIYRLGQLVTNIISMLSSQSYRYRTFAPFSTPLSLLDKPILVESPDTPPDTFSERPKRPYFEVLIVHTDHSAYETRFRKTLHELQGEHDEFLYEPIFVTSAGDALTAVMCNPMIQACVIFENIGPDDPTCHVLAQDYRKFLPAYETPHLAHSTAALGKVLRDLRPELDLYYMAETASHQLDETIRSRFDRVFHASSVLQDLHAHLLNGIRERFSTPFFHALQAYSRKPTGVFHALPISRANSLHDSAWTQDMLHFYGRNIFMAETSATLGGLDSLLDPKGCLKQSIELAARTFSADKTYFVTNGTSTANKIVLQATLCPGDIVLLASESHKSIPYGLLLCDVIPIFLESYPICTHDLSGAVSCDRIKDVLLDLKRQGLLSRVKLISLTNSTFDGILYNVKKFMMEILAIKPDIIFHWDEAWFAYGGFNPLYHHRTAMNSTNRLKQQFKDPAYQAFFDVWNARFSQLDPTSRSTWDQPLFPDPSQVKLRVYVTQSTHKTLSAFRQGSMIHIIDDAFEAPRFVESYRMHTSTSPNYQILASLDIGRRQVALDGFELVKKAVYIASKIRCSIRESETLQRYFTLLEDHDLVPEAHFSRDCVKAPSGEYARLFSRWQDQDFVVDPTRITLDIRKTGMSGPSFRELLATRYNLQVNKTSRFTVLFIVNIGSNQASAEYLVRILREIAATLSTAPADHSAAALHTAALSQSRKFYSAFRAFGTESWQGVYLRDAYYQAYQTDATEHILLDQDALLIPFGDAPLISAGFVTPYPPGYPILVPGQIVTLDILEYLMSLQTPEIHGYIPSEGLKVFKPSYLATLKQKVESNAIITPISS